jgi:hypothetical protein
MDWSLPGDSIVAGLKKGVAAAAPCPPPAPPFTMLVALDGVAAPREPGRSVDDALPDDVGRRGGVAYDDALGGLELLFVVAGVAVVVTGLLLDCVGVRCRADVSRLEPGRGGGGGGGVDDDVVGELLLP